MATYNITKTTLEIYQSSKRLETLEDEVEAKRQENADLKEAMEYRKTDGFVETEARNKLNMVKPGENILIPVVAGASDSKPSLLDELKASLAEEAGKSENYKKWIDLFF